MHSQRAKKAGDPARRVDRGILALNRTLAGTGRKACSDCKRVLSAASFYRDAQARDGLMGRCRSCDATRKQQYQQKNAHRIRAYQAQYRADPAHRAKARAATAKYRVENPERVRAAMARWMADPENRRVFREGQRRYRAQKKSTAVGAIAPMLLDGKLAYWGWRCHLVGPGCTVVPEHWDHVKPLVKGGLHCLANLRPACGNCNRRKAARHPYPIRYYPFREAV